MRRALLPVALLVPGVAAADEGNGLPRRFFDTRSAHDFGDAAPALRQLLATAAPRPRGVQHFCVVGYDDPDWRSAQVHWVEGNRMILWEGRDDPLDARDALRLSRRNLDLAADVVPTLADVHGSTYLVTRRWVRQVLADCAAHGRRYAVRAR